MLFSKPTTIDDAVPPPDHLLFLQLWRGSNFLYLVYFTTIFLKLKKQKKKNQNNV